MSRLVRKLCGMPAAMVPESLVTSGLENIGIGETFFELLRQGSTNARRSETLAFAGRDCVELESGEQIGADLVIFATGWRQEVPFLEPNLRGEVQQNGHFHLYRYILPPRERRLGFVGYASSANCPLTSEIAAHWLSQCFRGDLDLPDTAEMEREIARVNRWTAEVFQTVGRATSSVAMFRGTSISSCMTWACVPEEPGIQSQNTWRSCGPSGIAGLRRKDGGLELARGASRAP